MGDPVRPLTSGDSLSALDASFLYLERPAELLHVGTVSIVEGAVAFEAFLEMFARRLGALPRYRQRLVRPFLDLAGPAWEDDPHFDPRKHVHRLTLPAPGGEAELHQLVDGLFARPMDARRPPWETHVIGGLAGDRSAILTKVHHRMIDGVSGSQILALMSDASEGNGAAETHAAAPAARPAAGLARGALAGLREVLATATSPERLRHRLRDAMGAAEIFAGLMREPMQPMPFNGPLTGARRIVWARFALDDILAMRGTAGCKVSDVVLAVITGALRRYLPPKYVAGYGSLLRALVPVSVRSEDEHLTPGNRASAVLAHLPIGVADPVDRLRCVADEMRSLTERGQRQAFDFMLAVTGALPSPVGSMMRRFSGRNPVLHTVCTNIPGSRAPRFVLGRRILEVHPIVPLAADVGLGFAILSYAGQLSICATADAALVPDAERVRAALHASFEELRTHLGIGAAGRPAAQGGPSVGELMTRDVLTVSPDDPLDRPWEIMRVRRVRHLPVTDAAGHLVGIVTHRDLVAATASSLSVGTEAERVRLLGWARVADVMETHISTASTDEPAADAGRRMVRHKIGCLPVVDDGLLVGIVTEEDFLRWATEHMTGREGTFLRVSDSG